MSYSVSWKIEAKTKTPFYINIADYPRRQDNITYNVKYIMELSTGMEWSDGDKGFVKDIIPKLKNAIKDIKAMLSKKVSFHISVEHLQKHFDYYVNKI